MWFRVLSILIAVVLLTKSLVALAATRRFYAARQKQYSSETLPHKLLVSPVLVLGITLIAWYATFFHYQPWGWIVTGILTLIAGMAFHHVFHWERHRQTMLRVVSSPKVTRVDAVLLCAGLGFLALAFFVY